jgi:uncharacterized protein (TIGR02449 family)
MFRTLSDHDESGAFRLVHLPLRGQRRLGVPLPVYTLLLPVELRCVNHTASTNVTILTQASGKPYNVEAMLTQPQFDQIAERVERLLVRHEELRRTNELLSAQVDAVTRERDSLKSRLGAARARVDALLERLPEANPSKGEA